jgi:hypothetical protein
MANAAGVQPDQDLVRTRGSQLELGDLERLACGRKDCCDRPQRDGSPGIVADTASRCIRRSSSIG